MYNAILKAPVRRRRLLGLFAAAGTVGAFGPMGAALAVGSASDDLVVVELFTSQGCNSCPPADAFLRELTEQKNVLALSLPIDYWDYLGWKDTLADPSHTARQAAYRQSFGLRQMYTPQMVIQGRREGVGSRTRDIQAKIGQIQTSGASKAGVEIISGAEAYEIKVTPKGPFEGTAGVWLVFYDPVHEVAIKSGENGGRTLSYHNVVRGMMALGEWSGAAETYTLPKSEMRGEGTKCAVLVQQEGAGPILAAAIMP